MGSDLKDVIKMTGRELIEYIVNNHLEDYTIEVSHEIGESSYPVREVEVNNEEKTIEVI